MATILIVEDNEETMNNLLEYLSIENHTLRSSSNGIEALKILQEFTPDIIISDIQMPEMDGITFLREKQRDSRFQSIPFIFLTANVSNSQKLIGLEGGAIDYITKPFQMSELHLKIKNLTDLTAKLQKKTIPIPLSSKGNDDTIQFKANFEKALFPLLTNSNLLISDVASEMNMSLSTLQRNVSRYYKMSFSDLVKLHRIENSLNLLLNTDKSVEEIAKLCGFNSLSYFSRCFKNEYKISPIKYRLNNLR